MLFKKRDTTVDIKWRLIGLLGKSFIDFLFCASKITVRGKSAVKPFIDSGRCIYAFWHSQILFLSYFHKNQGVSILVSNSEDGEIIAQVLQRQGHTTIRGSTGKGGLRALTKQIQDIRTRQCSGAVVPDGPQGPRQKVQPGVILLAQKTGCPIIPLCYSAKRRVVFNSWDRFILPLPATPCLLIYGEPIHVPPKLSGNQLRQNMLRLENELNHISAEADRHFGHTA